MCIVLVVCLSVGAGLCQGFDRSTWVKLPRHLHGMHEPHHDDSDTPPPSPPTQVSPPAERKQEEKQEAVALSILSPQTGAVYKGSEVRLVVELKEGGGGVRPPAHDAKQPAPPASFPQLDGSGRLVGGAGRM